MEGNGTQVPRSELRLALVLYGGVSLCIYMHGTTKEINRLVSASAMLASGVGLDATPSEKVYRELLEYLVERDGVRTDISVDVIAGTSAGGINGVYLAKALARNLSQDELRDLWLDRGDLNALMCGPSFLNWRARIPGVVARLSRKPALHGEKMAKWLYEALVEMDSSDKSAPHLSTLMPQGASMDLMVTMTDYNGYDRQVAITSPKIVHDEQHRHVIRFSQVNDTNRYGAGDNLALAFAARATSCFPGAFEPVSPRSLCEWVSAPGPIGDEFFRSYELSGVDPQNTRFIDGGVLDNRPFAPAIEALRRKPAQSEVQRWVLYLDPDPAPPLKHRTGSPRPLEAIIGSIAGLPRKQPIIDSLLELDTMNEHVLEVRDVIEASFPRVRDLVSRLSERAQAEGSDEADPTSIERVLGRLRVLGDWSDWSDWPRPRTVYTGYFRARVAGMIDMLADAVCTQCRYPSESNHAMLTRRIWRLWAQRSRLFFDATRTDTDELSEPFDGLDVNFALRRIRFTLAGVNWLYARAAPDAEGYRDDRTNADRRRLEPDEREALDGLKSRLWSAIAELEGALTVTIESQAEAVRACFPEAELGDYLGTQGLDAGPWLDERNDQINELVGDLRAELTPRLRELTSTIYQDVLAFSSSPDLRVRYLGFVLFDAALYPLEYAAGVGEGDRVDVMRLSPQDTSMLAWSQKPKLKGTLYGHFGAFMKRAWRENDYLAGRLDGAERMVCLLVGEDNEQACEACCYWSGKAFGAILEEEASALSTISPLLEEVREQAKVLSRSS